MADQAKSDKSSKTPVKNKVVRSQKITQLTSPTESSSNSSKHKQQHVADAARDRDATPRDNTTAIPRSHTPGHLATKSNSDKRRKDSDLALRQRAQSSVASPTSATLEQKDATPSRSKTPGIHAPPPVSRVRTHDGREETVRSDSLKVVDKDRSSTMASNTRNRPSAMRSTSAIVNKHATTSILTGGTSVNSLTGHSLRPDTSSKGAYGAEGHTTFPPLALPVDEADEVPVAPASGMYWSRAPVSGSPSPNVRAHTTTLLGSNVYIFGGCDARACFNEIYVLDADAFYWSKPLIVGEIPLPLRAMTCTAVGKKLVVFGGGDGPQYYSDIYVLDTVNFRWSKPKILGDRAPSKRRAHTACLYKNGIYIFGGGDGIRALNDIWRLDVADVTKMSWKLISPPTNDKSPAASARDVSSVSSSSSARPKARGYHTANMVGSKLIIYGGSDGGECFNDVWVYDVDMHIWKCVVIPLTYRRLSHTATIVGSYLFVLGGHDGNEYSNDVLLLNLVTMTWDKRKIYGKPPSGRGYHGTVLYDSRLLTIGGFDGNEVFGDVLVLELAVHAYYSQISHFTIEV